LHIYTVWCHSAFGIITKTDNAEDFEKTWMAVKGWMKDAAELS